MSAWHSVDTRAHAELGAMSTDAPRASVRTAKPKNQPFEVRKERGKTMMQVHIDAAFHAW